jgi:hypothetical protein
MRTLRLISTAAAILLLGAGAVSAQGMKTNETPSAPAAQQNAPSGTDSAQIRQQTADNG